MIPDFINHRLGKITEICKNYRVNAAYLFGSVLTDKLSDKSDIDLVVDFKTDIEGLLQRRVDLISRKTIRNEILRNEIDSSKVLIYAAQNREIIVTTLTKFPGTLARYQDQMFDVFSRAVPAKKFEVFLFGSRARGDEEEGSDADLAISGTEIDRCDLSLIREQWEYSTIPMMLDLVDLKEISSALGEQIEKEKVLLWTSN